MSAPRILTVRASSWGKLFDCAYAWEGEHLLGYKRPAGLRAQLGTAVHASTAAFDAGRLPGASPVSAMDAADLVVATLRNPEREVDFSRDDLTVGEAEAIGDPEPTPALAVPAPQLGPRPPALPTLKLVSLLFSQSVAMDYYEEDVPEILTRSEIRRFLVGERTTAQLDADEAILSAFVREIQVGESVLLLDARRSEVVIGTVTGRYEFAEEAAPAGIHHRAGGNRQFGLLRSRFGRQPGPATASVRP